MPTPFLIYKDGTLQGIQDEFVVKLKSGDSYSELKFMAQSTGATILRNDPYSPDIYVLQTAKDSDGNALEMANYFHETGLFEWAEPNFLLLLKKLTNDTFFDYQWSLENTGSAIQYNGTPDADMDVVEGWTISTGSASIKVAILDEGVDLTHPDLLANMLSGYDATGLGSGGGPSGDDAHGTACAGIVAAVAENNLGVAGVAYDSKIIPVRIAYTGTGGGWITSNTWIADAINWSWMTAGADVLSNSWGGGSVSSLIDGAILSAITNGRGGLGSPVLFSAGNGNGAVKLSGQQQQYHRCSRYEHV